MAELKDRRPVEDWTTDFDHFDPAFTADPYPIYDDLRARCPVAHSERYGGMDVLTRWEDIQAVAHDPETFSSRRIMVNEVPTSHPGMPLPPINVDPPDHTAARRIMLPYFNPVAVGRWEQPIRDICDRSARRVGGPHPLRPGRRLRPVRPRRAHRPDAGRPRRGRPDVPRAGCTTCWRSARWTPSCSSATTDAMLDYMRELLAQRAGVLGTTDGIDLVSLPARAAARRRADPRRRAGQDAVPAADRRGRHHLVVDRLVDAAPGHPSGGPPPAGRRPVPRAHARSRSSCGPTTRWSSPGWPPATPRWAAAPWPRATG